MNLVEKNQIAYAELINRCWEDPDYLAKFKEDPASALEEFGIETVAGAKYHIVSSEDMQPDTAEDIYLPYAENPKTHKLSIEEVDKIAGGGFFYKKSNVFINTNIGVDTQGAVESLAAAVTVEVAAVYG